MTTYRTIFLTALFAATSAIAGKPQIQWDPAYDFSTVETFAWKDSPAAVSLAQADPFLHAHIENAIEFELTSSGLNEVDTRPDVWVTYYGSTETQVRLQSDSHGYGWAGYGTPGWGYYGYGRAGPISTTTRVMEYERGTLVIDIVDASNNELIWRGSIADISVVDDPEKMQKNMTNAIRKLVKQSQKLRARARS